MESKQRHTAIVACRQDVTASLRLVLLFVCLTQLVTSPAVEARAQPSLHGDGAGRSPHRKLQQLFGSNSLLQGFPTPTASICPASQTKISCFDPASDVPRYICCPSASYVCNVSSRTCVSPNAPAPTAPLTPAPTPAPTIPYPGPPVKGTGQLDLNCTVDQVFVLDATNLVDLEHTPGDARTFRFNYPTCSGTVDYNGVRAGVFHVPFTHNCPGAVLTELQVNVHGVTVPGSDFNPPGGIPVVEGLTGCSQITEADEAKPLLSCFLKPSVISNYYVPPGFQPNQVIGQLPMPARNTYYVAFLDATNSCDDGSASRFYFEAAGAIFEYQA